MAYSREDGAVDISVDTVFGSDIERALSYLWGKRKEINFYFQHNPK